MTQTTAPIPPSELRQAAGSGPDGPRLPGLSVVLPCFNEEDNVADAIRYAAAAATAVSEDYEILVVDDGSSDRTAEVASAFATADHRVNHAGVGGSRGGGHVALIAAGPAARRGATTAVPANHYALLRTIETGFGLPPLQHAGAPTTPLLSGLLTR